MVSFISDGRTESWLYLLHGGDIPEYGRSLFRLWLCVRHINPRWNLISECEFHNPKDCGCLLLGAQLSTLRCAHHSDLMGITEILVVASVVI